MNAQTDPARDVAAPATRLKVTQRLIKCKAACAGGPAFIDDASHRLHELAAGGP